MHIGFKDIPQTQEPGIVQMASNLAHAIPDIIMSKFKKVPHNVFDERMSICNTCHFWDSKGNLNLGKCTHSKCGCSSGKMRFAVSKCPIGNWGEYVS